MAARRTNRRADKPASRPTVKVQLTLSLETAQRLGVEASMTRASQSEVAEGVLARHLARWRLPSLAAGPGPNGIRIAGGGGEPGAGEGRGEVA